MSSGMSTVVEVALWALQALIVAILLGWVVVTVANQRRDTRRLVRRITNLDICGLVPIWTFFAPNPGDTDVHLLFRDRDQDGRVTCWREVKLTGRRWILDLWSPQRRINKAIVDVAYDLARPDDITQDAQPSPDGPLLVNKRRVLSFPYLLILNYVSSLTGDFGAVERQFAIARTPGMRGRDRPQVTLVSAFHRVG